MHDQIVGLLEQIKFLQEDSIRKSNIIMSLIEINKIKDKNEISNVTRNVTPAKINASDRGEITLDNVHKLLSSNIPYTRYPTPFLLIKAKPLQ